MFNKADQDAVNAVRVLAVDMINEANSGHPGLPIDAAPMAYVLWSRHIRQNPADPKWPDRDRFVLSAGHGSAMLYALLHLSGYDLSIDDLKAFRQLGSATPGHPEVGNTIGVEATTGPLGQGFANAVGMAIAERHLAAEYNQDQDKIVDHYTYCICSDGDLMEGISYESASLAGHLKLDRLIVLYDSNDVCLDGSTDMTFTDDIRKRFESAGWQYLRVEDGNDLEAINKAICRAKAETNHPSLIEVKTIIGYGSQLQGTNAAHGRPLGKEDRNQAVRNWGWEGEPFVIPDSVYRTFEDRVGRRGAQAEAEWEQTFDSYREKHPEEAETFIRTQKGDLPEGWFKCLPRYEMTDEAKGSRKYSEDAIQALAPVLPEVWGGSADLKSSNNTYIGSSEDFQPDNYRGRNIWFGVREFAMGGIMNGIQLHGGTRIFGATFFAFSDYLTAAVRVAALSKLPVTYVFTHDSIGIGEDGPTHEPVEQLSAFRATPNTNVIRPADGNETSAAWKVAMESTETPTLLVLSRQALPTLAGTREKALTGVEKGAYVLSPQQGDQPEGILIASGSEVQLALKAQTALREDGIDVSVISMPCQELFNKQTREYQESVLPSQVRNRMAIEMGASQSWYRYVGLDGLVLGVDRFGASGRGDQVTAQYGFTCDQIVANYKEHFF